MAIYNQVLECYRHRFTDDVTSNDYYYYWLHNDMIYYMNNCTPLIYSIQDRFTEIRSRLDANIRNQCIDPNDNQYMNSCLNIWNVLENNEREEFCTINYINDQ